MKVKNRCGRNFLYVQDKQVALHFSKRPNSKFGWMRNTRIHLKAVIHKYKNVCIVHKQIGYHV